VQQAPSIGVFSPTIAPHPLKLCKISATRLKIPAQLAALSCKQVYYITFVGKFQHVSVIFTANICNK
jgi:hypothetical protein